MFRGKTVVITGCSRGIGAATVRSFAAQGADIFACVRKVCPESDLFSKLAEEFDVNIMPVIADLADSDSVKSAAKEILKRKCPIDVLVNNAGITHASLFEMTPESVFRSLFEVNFFGPVLFTQYLLKRIPAGGSIVNISSSSVFEANRGLSAYAGSKSALLTWSRCLARELGEREIRVNVVAPGVTKTDILKNLDENELREKVLGNALKRIGNPEDIASTVLFLASDRSKYITGQVFHVDGGLR